MANEDSSGSEDAYTRLVPIIWTALRMLGLYMAIVGAGSITEHLARIAGSDTTTAELAYYRPRLLGDLVYSAGGLYLIFGGRWLIKNVFLSAKDEADDADNEEEAG